MNGTSLYKTASAWPERAYRRKGCCLFNELAPKGPAVRARWSNPQEIYLRATLQCQKTGSRGVKAKLVGASNEAQVPHGFLLDSFARPLHCMPENPAGERIRLTEFMDCQVLHHLAASESFGARLRVCTSDAVRGHGCARHCDPVGTSANSAVASAWL